MDQKGLKPLTSQNLSQTALRYLSETEDLERDNIVAPPKLGSIQPGWKGGEQDDISGREKNR
jgi:hypothetical protein